jgi:hypothetical protein
MGELRREVEAEEEHIQGTLQALVEVLDRRKKQL